MLQKIEEPLDNCSVSFLNGLRVSRPLFIMIGHYKLNCSVELFLMKIIFV
jgi:hypothetical protein